MTIATDTSKDKFDVTPKIYAAWAGVKPKTARKMFVSWFKQACPFIMRIGVSTEQYPDGKNLLMSRAHFTMLQQRSIAPAPGAEPIRRN